jgi:uncharacterized protein
LQIFDVHVHVQPWQLMRADALAMMNTETAKEVLSSADSLLRYLDQEGVERICCINYVSPDVMGFPRETNDWISDFTREHRDRLLPVGSVNPLHVTDVRGEIERVLDLGMRMVKIHPPHQLFAPNAYRFDLPALSEVYRACSERGVPVMIHTGTSVFPRARNIYADPMPIDDVAVDFPDLKIIMAHLGRPLYAQTAFFLLRRHANVFADISGIPPRGFLKYFPRAGEVAGKLLWGTDWPSPGVTSMKRNVDQFRSLWLDDPLVEQVFSSNAASLFAA